MSVTFREFGKTSDGRPIQLAELGSGSVKVEILNYGGIIRSMVVPSLRMEEFAVDIVLGYDTVAEYEKHNDFMGAVVGRFANRIGGAAFPLNGETVHITANENGNCLHSGAHGFQNTLFDMYETPDVSDDSVTLTATSSAGTDGFPGNVTLTLRYTLLNYGLANHRLVIDYHAETDTPTVCNLTNHSYFNLNGYYSGSVLDHLVTVDADQYLETDAQSIPTGRLLPVAGTPMDFTTEKPLGRDIDADFQTLKDCRGYDHCYVIRGEGLRRAAYIRSHESLVSLEVLTTQPAMHLYSGNNLASVTPRKHGVHPYGLGYDPLRPYVARDALCLETEGFPDAPNHPNFPSTLLLPGKPYDAQTVYKVGFYES